MYGSELYGRWIVRQLKVSVVPGEQHLGVSLVSLLILIVFIFLC